MAYEEHVDPPDDFDGDSEEIDAEEREALQQDLIDVNTLKSVLASRGIKGVVAYCPDCEAFSEDRTGEDTCAWCGTRLPEGGYVWSYCPTCGRHLGPINLTIELRRQGWSDSRIGELLERSGFERPVFEPESETDGGLAAKDAS